LQRRDSVGGVHTVEEGCADKAGDEADCWGEEGDRAVDERLVSYLVGGISVHVLNRKRDRLTACTLLTTRERALATTTIAEQTTSAIVGLRSNSLGHNGRRKFSPRCVELNTDRVSPDVPRIVMEESRANAVKARRADSTMRADLALFWCPASGVSNSLNSEANPGLKSAMVRYVID
jgi:hypothetical protein